MKSRIVRFIRVQWNLIIGLVAGVALGVMYNLQWYIPLAILSLIALVLLSIGMYRFNVQAAAALEKAERQLAEINARKESYAVSE